MADKTSQVADDGDKNKNQEPGDAQNSLESFVTDHYKRQKEAGNMDSTDELSDERTNDFFSRAIGESRRMNAEVNKSNKKLDAIHAEFGLDMINQWQSEHSSEVLEPYQQQLVKNANYQSPDAAR
ncbi:hypothetical protein ACF0H5_023940 [Mactra antiquata]